MSGTSASCPVVAGMVSLVNSARAEQGRPTLGFLNPALYALSSSFVKDVTVGDNCCLTADAGFCCEEGFYASAGWDPVSGLGSVDFTKFRDALMGADTFALDSGVPSARPAHFPSASQWLSSRASNSSGIIVIAAVLFCAVALLVVGQLCCRRRQVRPRAYVDVATQRLPRDRLDLDQARLTV